MAQTEGNARFLHGNDCNLLTRKREEKKAMTYVAKTAGLALLLAPLLLSACVSQSDYDKLQAENTQLQQQNAADKAHITRLQGAIKYVVNSDLAFAPGSWELSADGKDTIAKLAKHLVPSQEKLVVTGYTDNSPIGPGLAKMGVTSNLILSQKRADAVMQFIISQGVEPSMIRAQGMGEQDPVASNSTAEGRAQNRRVEISLDK